MTVLPHHVSLAAARWQTLTLAEQFAHIGSEVERALRAHADARSDRWDHALGRALELFDLTAAADRWRGHRRREALRVRELFCEQFFGDRPDANAPAFLRKYFLQFAVLARRTR